MLAKDVPAQADDKAYLYNDLRFLAHKSSGSQPTVLRKMHIDLRMVGENCASTLSTRLVNCGVRPYAKRTRAGKERRKAYAFPKLSVAVAEFERRVGPLDGWTG